VETFVAKTIKPILKTVETVQLFDNIYQRLAAYPGNLPSDEAAVVIGTTREDLASDRITGKLGIPFIKISARKVVYEPGAIADFLRRRTAMTTAESNKFSGVDLSGVQKARLAMKRGRPKKEHAS
jgi:hypothetical protein